MWSSGVDHRPLAERGSFRNLLIEERCKLDGAAIALIYVLDSVNMKRSGVAAGQSRDVRAPRLKVPSPDTKSGTGPVRVNSSSITEKG